MDGVRYELREKVAGCSRQTVVEGGADPKTATIDGLSLSWVDPTLTVERGSVNGNFVSSGSEGEYIYAAEFRRITFNCFFLSKIDKAKIQTGSTWKVYAKLRAATARQKEGVAKAALEDEFGDDALAFSCHDLDEEFSGDPVTFFSKEDGSG